MAVTDSREVVIEATPDEIMDVLFDVESLPEWSSAHRKVDVLERDDQGHPSKSRQVVKVVGVSDEQVLAYTVHDDGVGWTLVSAKQQRAQQARYTLTPEGDSTRVRFELMIDLNRSGPRILGQERDPGPDGHGHQGPAEASARGQEGRQVVALYSQAAVSDTFPMNSAASSFQRITLAIAGAALIAAPAATACRKWRLHPAGH